MKRKSSKVPEWVVMGDGGARCLRCGKAEPMRIPMPVDAFGAWGAYVGALHAKCADTGRVDPTPSSVEEWVNGHDTGISSKAIYRHMMGIAPDPRERFGDYPRDPSDFGRCYRLLALAPSWRARIGEMASHGKEWAALAGTWDELTAMWEEVVASKAKFAGAMYDRMQALHSPRAVSA